MEPEGQEPKKSNRGGPRPGSGRKKGSKNKNPPLLKCYVKKNKSAPKYVPKSEAEAERLRKLSERMKKQAGGKPGAGRPKGTRAFKDIISEKLAVEVKDKNGKVATAQEAAVMAQIQNAIKGDLNALRWLADRVEGTPLQAIDSTLHGPGNGPIEVKDASAVDAEIDSVLDAALAKAAAPASPKQE